MFEFGQKIFLLPSWGFCLYDYTWPLKNSRLWRFCFLWHRNNKRLNEHGSSHGPCTIPRVSPNYLFNHWGSHFIRSPPVSVYRREGIVLHEENFEKNHIKNLLKRNVFSLVYGFTFDLEDVYYLLSWDSFVVNMYTSYLPNSARSDSRNVYNRVRQIRSLSWYCIHCNLE